MKVAVRIAQAGNQILNIIVMGIILFLFLYGGYSLCLWIFYASLRFLLKKKNAAIEPARAIIRMYGP